MKLWTTLRIYGFLRRAVSALERIATAQENLSKVQTFEWERKHGPRRPAHPLAIDYLNVRDAEKDWKQRQAELGLDDPDEDN